MATEAVTVRVRPGLQVTFECYAVGAATRKTQASSDDDPRYYHRLELAPDPGSQVVRAFCEEEQRVEVTNAIKREGRAVRVVVDARVTEGAINVESIKFAE